VNLFDDVMIASLVHPDRHWRHAAKSTVPSDEDDPPVDGLDPADAKMAEGIRHPKPKWHVALRLLRVEFDRAAHVRAID